MLKRDFPFWEKLLLAALLLLFVLGFLSGEDALGGGVRMDLYLYHGPTMFALRDRGWLQVLPDYNSATTPLFHLLESLNPLLGHDLTFRAFNLLVGLGTAVLFAIALRARFPGETAAGPAPPLIAASLLLSPYFRAETFWVSTDILPVLLLILCGWLLLPVQDQLPRGVSPPVSQLRAALILLLAWATFYCRQTYLFLPLYATALLWARCPQLRAAVCLLNVLAAAPAVWLFSMWRGLNPPAFQHHTKLSASGVLAPLSMVLVYALPFLADAVLSRPHLLTEARGAAHRGWWWAAFGSLLFLLAFHAYRFDPGNAGGGVLSKLFSRMGAPGIFLFLLCSYLGLLLVLWLTQRSDHLTRWLIVLFLLPTFTMSIVYQRYYDPILFILFFLFLPRGLVRPFVSLRMGLIVTAFSGLLLLSALASNVKGGAVFWPVTSQAHPWTGTPLDGRLH